MLIGFHRFGWLYAWQWFLKFRTWLACGKCLSCWLTCCGCCCCDIWFWNCCGRRVGCWDINMACCIDWVCCCCCCWCWGCCCCFCLILWSSWALDLCVWCPIVFCDATEWETSILRFVNGFLIPAGFVNLPKKKKNYLALDFTVTNLIIQNIANEKYFLLTLRWNVRNEDEKN